MLGTEQPELAPTLSNLALLCSAAGRDEEAAMLYLRAIELLAGSVAPTHPTLARMSSRLRGARKPI